MDPRLAKFLQTNAQWAAAHQHENPIYFDQLKAGQKPHALLLGCSDSRVSPSVVMGAELGEVFVHRNIANVVAHSDLNFLSVLQYAIEVLEVREIIVFGHYGCGGIKAAMDDEAFGLIDNWLANIKDVMEFHAKELDAITDPQLRHDRLVELNVLAQIKNLQQTSVIRKAIKKGITIHIHGWIYDFSTGHIKVVYEPANEPAPQL
ncbi:MAG: carbonic anhydrase [Lewinellaceae bacterium]|nr:carbonic anhydrase [Lewinellaceae bacterium]